MLDATYVIKKPVVTEKSAWEASRFNRYTFEIDRLARKVDVARAIQEIYGVTVEKVATQVRKGEAKRTRFGTTRTSDKKRAIVQLKDGDTIDLI